VTAGRVTGVADATDTPGAIDAMIAVQVPAQILT
jgi:hypothetical protein